jgi:uncharacterized protein YkwD
MHSLLHSAILLAIISLAVAYSANPVLSLVNKERAKNGVKPLVLSKKLNAVALKHSKDQAKQEKISHLGSDGSKTGDRCKKGGYATSNCDETIATNFKTGADCIRALLKNPGHRDVVLNAKSVEFGSAVAYDAKGNSYYTQVYGNPRASKRYTDKQPKKLAPAPSPDAKSSSVSASSLPEDF